MFVLRVGVAFDLYVSLYAASCFLVGLIIFLVPVHYAPALKAKTKATVVDHCNHWSNHQQNYATTTIHRHRERTSTCTCTRERMEWSSM